MVDVCIKSEVPNFVHCKNTCTLCLKMTVMLHNITSTHINRFWQFLAEMLLREYAIEWWFVIPSLLTIMYLHCLPFPLIWPFSHWFGQISGTGQISTAPQLQNRITDFDEIQTAELSLKGSHHTKFHFDLTTCVVSANTQHDWVHVSPGSALAVRSQQKLPLAVLN